MEQDVKLIGVLLVNRRLMSTLPRERWQLTNMITVYLVNGVEASTCVMMIAGCRTIRRDIKN